MQPKMNVQVPLGAIGLAANRAAEGLLARVRSVVCFELETGGKRLAAVRASEFLLPVVPQLMVAEHDSVLESLVAYTALERSVGEVRC